MSAAHPIVAGLNKQQAAAVQSTEGPLLLLAGAGSGKTRVLVHRIAWMIDQGLASPDQILAVTFTNKAAREMRERAEQYIGPQARAVWISTFHSACTRILRAHAEALDLNPNFTIFDATDQRSLIKEVLLDMEINPEKHKPVAVLSQIEKAKQQYRGPASFGDYENMSGLPFARVYRAYQDRLRAQDALDFSDLLFECVRLFEEHPDILQRFHAGIRYLMIDEYQDTNHLQYKWTTLLASGSRNLCVVGDDDQSIYSWRGADIRNILEFQKDFQEAQTIKLEQNYRSTQNILDAAYDVIRHNRDRTEKKLWTDQKGGEKIRLQGFQDEVAEAKGALEWLMRDTREDQLRNRALFYRTNAQSRLFEEECIKRRIPYRVYGGVGFYSRKEVKDILAYMRVLVNPRDLTGLARIINVPARGIGKVSLDKLLALCAANGNDIFMALEQAAVPGTIGGAAQKKIAAFAKFMFSLRGYAAEMSVTELAHAVLDESGYLQALKLENTEEAKNRIENIDELVRAMEQFEEGSDDVSISAYLQSVSLLSDVDQDQGDDVLSLMTLHMAKGLEFERVAITGLEEEILPNARSLADDPLHGIEEERRLTYVGITRARKELALFYAQSRRVWGQWRPGLLSRFVQDIPDALLDNQTRASAYDQSSLFGAGHQPQQRRQSPYRNRKPVQRQVDPPKRKSYQSSTPMPSGTKEMDGWKVGMKVRHPSLGTGTIKGIESSSVGPKLAVRFRSESKVILPKYVALEILDS